MPDVLRNVMTRTVASHGTKNHSVTTRLTYEQRNTIRLAARQDDRSDADFVRLAALAAAEKILSEAA